MSGQSYIRYRSCHGHRAFRRRTRAEAFCSQDQPGLADDGGRAFGPAMGCVPAPAFGAGAARSRDHPILAVGQGFRSVVAQPAAVCSLGTSLGGCYLLFTRYRAGAIALWAGVVSNWVLDTISHRPDMPFYPNSVRVGLGLYNSRMGTVAVEILLLALGA